VQLKELRNVVLECSRTGYGESVDLSSVHSYEDFRKKVPLSTYESLAPYVEAQMTADENQICPDVLRYIPTSGSTNSRKWIPFNDGQQNAFDRASSPWLYDLSTTYPKIQNGQHYWSLSWLPDTLRSQGNIADDLELFPLWKRELWKRAMAVPSSVAFAPSSEASIFATACYLCAAEDLSLISVWSPTFLLAMTEAIERWRSPISETLRRGSWQKYSNELKNIAAPKTRKDRVTQVLNFEKKKIEAFWPNLVLISCWDSHSSNTPAEKLKSICPHTAFQGKGLWATEGVTTIPFMGRFPLALRSHFYEFLSLDDGQIKLAGQLRPGMIVQPILTCRNGFLRYQTDDQLLVNQMFYSTPCFTFIGRHQTTDLCGEKLTPQLASQVFNDLKQRTGLRPISLVAVSNKDKPYYHLIAEGSLAETEEQRITLESLLSRNHHYAVARELNQLGPVRLTSTPEAMDRFIRIDGPQVNGSKKIDPVMHWDQSRSVEDIFLN
jgi:hypothetical protein